MKNHKIRPKLNIYSKLGINPLIKKNNNKISSKKQIIKFFSPDLVYLSTKFSTKLKNQFQTALLNKKKIKFFFGFYRTALLKKILRKNLVKNFKTRHIIKEIEFCSILERRLDVILYRLGFVATLYEAKHLISHKKVKVNNLPNACFSRLLKPGDIVSFEPAVTFKIKQRIVEQAKKRFFIFHTFNNLEISYKSLKIIYLKKKINMAQQLKYYSSLLNWKILMQLSN